MPLQDQSIRSLKEQNITSYNKKVYDILNSTDDLSHINLLDIRLWLKFTNVADLTREHPVRKIVLWQELHSPDHTALE